MIFRILIHFLMILTLKANEDKCRVSVNKEDTLLNWYWSGNETELYCNITLDEGLCFDDLYFVYSDEKKHIAEISCKPLSTHLFETHEGYQLKKIQLQVTAENTASPKEIFYKIDLKHSYQFTDVDNKRKVYMVEHPFEDTFLNSTLDVGVEPLFYTFLEEPKSAVILFKNLFRCSE